MGMKVFTSQEITVNGKRVEGKERPVLLAVNKPCLLYTSRLDRLLRAAVNQTERSKADNQEADKQIGSRPAGGGYRRIRDGKKQEKAARRAKEA